ncbi:MAG: hypothetical protein JXL97_15890 [Bacteroidales bacterium]|nr:hypothetical protein [Bacteroidales bacterium]
MEYALPTPILYVIFPFLLVGFILNGFIIWLFTRKDVPIDKSYWMALLSYAVVAVLGLFISMHNNVADNFWMLMVYFGVALVFEWLFLYAYFQKFTYSWFRCVFISGVSNVLTFGTAIYFLFYGTGLLTKYANFVKIQLENQGIIN